MAFTTVIASGQTLVIPDSTINVSVASLPTGVATSGVIAFVGEADEGPSWDQDTLKLSSNNFGPTDISAVVQKYGSGNLVSAFSAAASPSNSPSIQGAPNSMILVKVNQSVAASLTTADETGTFTAKILGASGNLIREQITTNIAEAAPTSGEFSYVPSASGSALAVRINGGAQETLSISANETPTALAAALSSLSNVNAVGGVDRMPLAGLSGINISLAVISGQNVNITLAGGSLFAVPPQIGDTLNIPSGSVIQGGSNQNIGWYLVTAVVDSNPLSQITATKITAGAPAAVSATPISGTPSNDLKDYSYMTINDMSGRNRNVLSGPPSLVGVNATVGAVGESLTFTLASGNVFSGQPAIGDLLYIPVGSAFQGGGAANVGWFQVTAVSNTSLSAFITASMLSNGAPVAVSSTPIVALTDIQDLDPQIRGVGKAMEIYDNGGAVNINTVFLSLGVNSAASFVGELLVSSAELQENFSLVQSSTNTQESFNIGGNIAMTLGYNGTSAAATIAEVSGTLMLTTSVVGGAGANLSINLSKLPTINDLVGVINTNPGYSAVATTGANGNLNPSALDEMTLNICSSLGNEPGRIKTDIYSLISGVSGLNGSVLVNYTPLVTAGLPDDSANGYAYLQGGAKGGSSGLQWANAINALQAVKCNFVVPLVSQNASLDIAIGATDPSSTYMVDAVNAVVRAHCLSQSTAVVKRNRVGLVSKRDTFANAQAAAENLSSFRITCFFQDVLNLNSQGAIEQFQPWMGASVAAGMQAAGAYKSIFNKDLDISGALQAAGDFDDQNVTDVTNAILAGLVPIQLQDGGGYTFVTDQTTYNTDNNFVYNSLQAVYVADLIALSLASSLKAAFVGQSVADVTAGTVINFIKAQMFTFLSLKYIVPSLPNAPGGWSTINVNITPGVLNVSVTVVEATSFYFIPINLTIEGIQSSASA